MEQKCDTPYNFNLVHFVMSAPSISDLPEDTGAEVAFREDQPHPGAHQAHQPLRA